MSGPSLEELVREHYLRASLQPAVVSSWISAERQRLRDAAPARHPRVASRRLIVAAGLVLVAALAWMGWRASTPASSALARAIAVEVAAGHAKARPLDVEARTFLELRQRMDRLGFTLVDPGPRLGQELALLGARYCTLQGRAAALIRLQDERGEAFTLYQSQDHPSLSRLAEGQHAVDGSLVRIWREDGLLLVLATAAR